MKTINKIQKAALATIAATGLVILGLSVDSQIAFKSYFNNNESDKYAMVTGNTNHLVIDATTNNRNLADAGKFASYLEKVTDEPLHLEEWMINDFNSLSMNLLEVETENPLEIEDWMTEESNFDINTFNMETETEPELNVENWMINENNFNIEKNKDLKKRSNSSNATVSTRTYFFSDITDENNLKLENWMFKSNAWK